jgi:phosphomannomutase
MSIKFGTDGWRAVIAEEFTFENVRKVSRAIHQTFPESDAPIVVGHDTRFHSPQFAAEAAAVLAECGRQVLLTSGPCPTPSVSCQVVDRSSPFGISITASHNPPEFNGIKIKSGIGASAPPEVTQAVEAALSGCSGSPASSHPDKPARISFESVHLKRLAGMVDLEKIKNAGITVAFDSMHGAARKMLEQLLAGGSTTVQTLHGEAHPLFGGLNPEPIAANLSDMKRHMERGGCDIGLATDGDADRIGAFDEKGRFISPLEITPLLALSMLARGDKGEICKTFANTILLDRIATRHDLPFSVHPIGFKYIAERMALDGFLIGGEESGGIGIKGYLPERDGLLISLLMLEVLANEEAPLSRLLENMRSEYGSLSYARRDIPCPSEKGKRLADLFKERTPETVGRMKVTGVDDLDGVKLLFGDDGWILARASGTEPVLRVYCEAPTENDVKTALDDMLRRVSEA